MFESALQILLWVISQFVPGKGRTFFICIKQINHSDPEEVDEFISLYESTFPYDGENYSVSEILSLSANRDNYGKHVPSDNILLVAKERDEMRGFIAAFYYPDVKKAIIGYFGRDKSYNKDNKYITLKLLTTLKHVLTKKHKCEIIVFELAEDARADSKWVLFASYAKKLGSRIHKIDIPYVRPLLHLDDKHEEPLSLYFISIQPIIGNSVSKEFTLEIIWFLHYCCYGDYYSGGSPEHLAYHEYLRSRMEHYRNTLPNKISIS